jgi:putative addiction module killer protein
MPAMNTLLRSDVFDSWLSQLRDPKAKARILIRIRSAELGNFGDWKSVGEGVFEMRIDVGRGYRVYFTRRGSTTYLLLVAGDKKHQQRDIKRAIGMAQELARE